MKGQAEEKLRILDTIRENAGMVITIGGFIWLIFSFIIIPLYKVQYDIANILDNHLATIQSELTTATAERKTQTEQLNSLSAQVIKLTTILETNKQ